MDRKEEIITLIKQRADMYRFLARIFVLEIDADFLRKMKQMEFPEKCDDQDITDGYALMRSYLNGIYDQENDEKCEAGDNMQEIACAVTDLEVEYARIFLAAGVANGGAAFPYESVYTSKTHLVNQKSNEDVTMLYAAKGLKAREDMYRIPDDHAGLEFEYMARLCDDALAAAEAGDESGLDKSMEEQRQFYNEHIKRWIPLFGEDIRKYARTDFYRGIGRITRGFVAEETQLLR